MEHVTNSLQNIANEETPHIAFTDNRFQKFTLFSQVEKDAEEEQFRDLLLLMELLTNLLSKDFIDLAPQGKSSNWDEK